MAASGRRISRSDGRLRRRRFATWDTLLYTVLSDADRLGVLKIPHPMANRRVLLPKLIKRRPAVLDEAKLRSLFERARGTRLYPLAGFGCGDRLPARRVTRSCSGPTST